MHTEETSFIYNTKHLPFQVMDHQEYARRRDQATHSMVGDRLGVKGKMYLSREWNDSMIGPGIPHHQQVDIMRGQFERMAADQFTGQFDAQCNTCPHCKLETKIAHNAYERNYVLHAVIECKAKQMVGATCFDGYMPSMDKWTWPENIEAVGAEMMVVADGEVRLVFRHDIPRTDYSLDSSGYLTRSINPMGDLHDEPPGPMTRMNADSGYLTEKEMVMANEALERTAKVIRATLPTPKPQTPMEDAW